MRTYLNRFLLVFLAAVSGLQAVTLPPGSQDIYLGYSGPAPLAMGYTGLGQLAGLEGNSFNPASSADIRRVTNQFSLGGFGSAGIFTNLGLAVPASFGVINASLLYGSNSSAGSNRLLGASLGLAKPVARNVFWGINLKFASLAQPAASDFQLAADLGLVYTPPSSASRVLGLHEPSFGLALKNLGKPAVLTGYSAVPSPGLGAGFSFLPVKSSAYKLKLAGDVSLALLPLNPSVNAGVENIFWDTVKIRAGYNLSSNSLGLAGVGPLHLGVAVAGKISTRDGFQLAAGNGNLPNSTDFELAYALQQQSYNGVPEWSHSLNLNLAWGYYDNVAPVGKVSVNNLYFSPNYDGQQDELQLALELTDNSLVKKWEVTISDDKGNAVKTYKSLDRLEVKNLSMKKFFQQVFSRKSQAEIPPALVWDGQNEAGRRLSDGNYFYSLKAWDDNDNLLETARGSIVLDTLVPQVEALAGYQIFSPNGDGAKDNLVFLIESRNLQGNDLIRADILAEKGNIVKTYEFVGQLPKQIDWDGRDQQGRLLPEGIYHFQILAVDRAGNQTLSRAENLRLLTEYQQVTLAAGSSAFSPNADGIKDAAEFSLGVSDQKGLESWQLKILDSRNQPVAEFAGQKNLPARLVWPGLAKNGQTLSDGLYSARLQLYYDSGNFPASEVVSLSLDNSSPEVTLEKPAYLSFSPNGDGKQDELELRQQAKGSPEDRLELLVVNQSGQAVVQQEYRLAAFPELYSWSGLDKNGNALPEGRYRYLVRASDAVGNQSEAVLENIVLKTGQEKVSVESSLASFSPDGNGKNDTVVFTPQVSSDSDIVSFVLEISEGNRVVKKFTFSDFQASLVWDGRDEAGKQLKDGLYNYQLKVKYSYGDEPASASRNLLADCRAPELSLALPDLFFSPNGDSRKENLLVKLESQGEASDNFKVAFRDAKGRTVRSYNWQGRVPAELVWDGHDDQGKDAPEGRYSLVATAEDSAGNLTEKKAENIVLVRTFEKVAFTADRQIFSPNGDGFADNLLFQYQISSLAQLESARLIISNDQEEPVRTFVLPAQAEGKLVWDGKNNSGRMLPDGSYHAQLLFDYHSGNLISAALADLKLDQTAPEYKLTVSPELFTPDADGENDLLYIGLELADKNAVKFWQMQIFKKTDEGKAGRLLKTFSGSGAVSQVLEWNGVGDDPEEQVESVQDYVLRLEAADEVGNKISLAEKDILVGVLVEKTDNGLRIRVSSIRFAYNSAALMQPSKANLDKVIYIIRRILSDPEKYNLGKEARIEISGHTDDIGSEAFNQTLSEKRARSVHNYLEFQDIDPKILTTVGYGETRPYKKIVETMDKDKKEDYRGRNRRVEFFIRK